MERRSFLKVAAGCAIGLTAIRAGAKAAPLLPAGAANALPSPANEIAQPAVTTKDQADRSRPEEVHWGRHGHWHWRGRHWGWRHRHWGWRHRHWGRRHHWGWRRRWHRY